MRITVIGTGYVGLVSGACLADAGNDVLCVDLDSAKVAKLERGELPIYEPNLDGIVNRNVAAGRLRFSTDIEHAVNFGALQIVAVGTPPDEDGAADVQYVLAAARNVGRFMTDYKVVIDKSTVPVGTADRVKAVISAELSSRGVQVPFSVVSNPEFLKEGAAVDDFMKPDRIVIGVEDERAAQLMRDLYAPFQRNHERMVMMDVRSAELTKYAANAMLATRISFMNELANIAEKLGADIEMVRRGIGSDPRIGFQFLYPGCGYGGSCLPKDVQALIRSARQDADTELLLLRAVEAVNDTQKLVLARKVRARFGENLSGRRFALWGLAFKPNTDDMREAPSLYVVRSLINSGATVTAYDPVATREAQRTFGDAPGLSYADSPLSALKDADALLVVTEWKEFRGVDLPRVAATLRSPVIFDGRNIYDPKMMRELGFEYFAIGR